MSEYTHNNAYSFINCHSYVKLSSTHPSSFVCHKPDWLLQQPVVWPTKQSSIEIHRVQMLQNIAARLVTRTPQSQSISQTLKKLHWLPIEKRIILKIYCWRIRHNMDSPLHTWQIYSHHTNQPVISVPATRHYYVFPKLVHHTMAADHLQLQDPPSGTTSRNPFARLIHS